MSDTQEYVIGNVKSYTAGNAGETVDVAQKSVNNAQGGTGNDTLIGDSTNNWLAGNLGADTLNAGAGDDVILVDSLDTIEGMKQHLLSNIITHMIGGRHERIF